MNSNESKWAQTSLNKPKWAESQNGPIRAEMSSKDAKYIQNDPTWAQNRSKWSQMSKPK